MTTLAARPSAFLVARRLESRQLTAGLTATLFYVFGPVPLYFAAVRGFGGEATAVSGFTAVFGTAAIGTAVLSRWYRQPLALGWSLPGLLFMVAATKNYPLAQVAGASLVASLAVVCLALAGVVERVERVIPANVAMALLAGSALSLCIAPFRALSHEPGIVAPTLAGFFLARACGKAWFPGAAGAVLLGLPAAALFGGSPELAVPAVPHLAPLLPALSPGAIVALTPPLVVFMVIGTAQGRAVLKAEGYEAPSRPVSVTTGMMGAAHAFFGAPPASVQRVGMAVLSGEEAGEHDRRWLAAVFGAIGCAVIVVFAVPLDAFTSSLDKAFVDTVIGLLLLKVLTDSLRRATEGPSMAGPISFCIAASAMRLGGLSAEFWALAIGCAVAFAERFERRD